MKQLILFMFFFILFVFQATSFAEVDVKMGPAESVYKYQLEKSLSRLRKNYLKLPEGDVTDADLQSVKSAVDDLDEMVATIHLGDFSIQEITDPLKKLDKAFRNLKRKDYYTSQEVSEIRRWCNYLIKEPITHTFLAKDDVLNGRKALGEKRFADAQSYLKRAIDHLGAIRVKAAPKLAPAVQRIESEITIFYTAAVREQILEEKKERSVVNQLAKSFETYHDTVYNMWSDVPFRERH